MKQILWAVSFCASLAFLAGAAWALPGAHGPNGEHLDGPGSAIPAATATPRLEATSEAFELVATLGARELSILVDRFDTNEPVLGATLEVESGQLKAVARFHADHGDYAVNDANFLKALSRPGEHPLVFTLVAGKDADLLEGVLRVSEAAAGGGHAPSWFQRHWLAIVGGIVLVAAAVGATAFLRRRHHTRALAGGAR